MEEKLPFIRVAIFASGAGSNARQIIIHFKNHPYIQIGLILSNKADAGVLEIAAKEQVASLVIDKEPFFNSDVYLQILAAEKIDFIVLAGFLWKIPLNLVRVYAGRILNIHPALLPKYGGKGMYGDRVHAAVIAAGDKESGITIHQVDELYDHGQVVFQASCPVAEHETPGSLAQKIHLLEHTWFPRIIQQVIDSQKIVKT